MDIQKIATSKFGVSFGLAIGRLLPRKLGYSLVDFVARRLANRTSSPVVQTVRANQWVVRGGNLSESELVKATYEVFNHAGKCFVDLYKTLNNPELMKSYSPASPQSDRLVELSNDTKQGVFVVAPHLSNFDLILLSNAYRGLSGMVLTYGQPTGGYEIQNEIRASTGLDITPVKGKETHNKAIQFMKDGGAVFTAVDRPIKRKSHTLSFFNRPSPLPAGHIRMALAANVPIVVVAAHLKDDGYYDVFLSDFIELTHLDDPDEEIRINGEKVLSEIEDFIRQVPGQWLMYYPAWPEVLAKLNS